MNTTAIIKFVDENGRVIPLKGMTGVVDANPRFRHVQPFIDIAAIHGRLCKHFSPKAKFPTLEEFGTRYAALQGEVSGNLQVSNLFKGSWFPICIPQTQPGDYGTILENAYLSAVESAHKEAFPDRTFKNWWEKDLSDKVTINDDTRHEVLVERLKRGPVIGLYFTSPLQGFGIEADRSVIRHLPEGFCLSGGFDTAAAFVADAKMMAQGFNTPAADCAALSWRDARSSLSLCPDDENLYFVSRRFVAGDRFSAGLLFFR